MSTAKSSIMEVFPRWADHLGLDAAIEGIDCRLHDDPERYRAVVRLIRDEPRAAGALITAHKVDLFQAAGDLLEELDPYARLLGELSCIAKRDDRLHGFAKDPIPAGLALESFVPRGHWARSGGRLCLLGAGGSSLALSARVMEWNSDGVRVPMLLTDTSASRLEEVQRIHARVDPSAPIEYHHAPSAADADRLVGTLPPGSVVVNATGAGKDIPGSPLSDAALFPPDGYAWDFNYRGDLGFLRQARRQARARGLQVEDGWGYFLYGWTTAIAEVFRADLPAGGPRFDELCRIAGAPRRR